MVFRFYTNPTPFFCNIGHFNGYVVSVLGHVLAPFSFAFYFAVVVAVAVLCLDVDNIDDIA